jgi:acyl-coenzyme A synthetase/AMP-(fatty) acid ligase
LLAEGSPDFPYTPPDDEWDALALNYTSGTTGQPKGVVYSHRGAWTNAVNNVVTWEMPHHPVYLVDAAALSLQRLVLPLDDHDAGGHPCVFA